SRNDESWIASSLPPSLVELRRTSRFACTCRPRETGCVKTRTSRECAELFSLFSSFDGDCQNGSFVIRRSRDKLSTRKSEVEVFTQPSLRGRQCLTWP